MKFGKLHAVENVDFTLPPEPTSNTDLFATLGKEGTRNLFIGATGWGMKEWVGKYYPKGSKSTDFLRHYAEQFNTIELNTTHYRIPAEPTVKKWYDQSTADFRFCPKVPQRISHSRHLSPEGPIDLTRQFCESIHVLKEKLGPCFIQLPPYFGFDRMPILEAFLERWKRFDLNLAVEVRHESWFENPAHLQQLADMVKKRGASLVITDVAGRRDVCHSHLTTDHVLVRFVGNGLHPTDFSRIDDWVKRLDRWFEKGLKNVYFFTHEPDNLLAPELATVLAEKMKGKDNLNTRGPVPILTEEGGEQMSLF